MKKRLQHLCLVRKLKLSQRAIAWDYWSGHLKNRSVPDLPVFTPSVERLQAPVLQRPAAPQRCIPFMDLVNQLRDGFPGELPSDFASHGEVNAGDEEIAAALHQTNKVA